MSWARGTSIVTTIARVVQLTGQQDLANLEVGGELSVPDVLLAASQSIHDQLKADGIDPSAITNEEVYEEVVAWNFLARLVILGYLAPPGGLSSPETPYSWSDPYYQRKRPELAAGDEPRVASEVLPVVVNQTTSTYTNSPSAGRLLWGFP